MLHESRDNEYRGSNPALPFAASSGRPTAARSILPSNGADGLVAPETIPPTDGDMPSATEVYHPSAASSFTASIMERLENCDPTHPKIMQSAYSFFFAERHSELKVQHPHMEREYNKMIGDSWNKLTAEERQDYEDIASKDRGRYRKEMQGYKERLKFAEPREFCRARRL